MSEDLRLALAVLAVVLLGMFLGLCVSALLLNLAPELARCSPPA